jgi:serine/threonine-protein kinase
MIGSTLSYYRIDEELGRGGMGIVYRGFDTKLDRTVAIKVLPASVVYDAEAKARFYREAKSAAQLSHPHICHVYQVDEAVPADAPYGAEPQPFIAMEFVAGKSVLDLIKEGPLTIEEALRIAAAIAEGLGAAHAKGIVHRDIKPGNVMLDGDGVVKVLDFGLAKTIEATALTRDGGSVGTITYMSPEQARGDDVDGRSDLFSLGVGLWEMLA